MAVPVSKYEDELGIRWDRCIADSILKLGGGIFIGGLTSLIFFKRKRWPVLVSAGFGIGLAYGNCERELKDVLSLAPSKEKA